MKIVIVMFICLFSLNSCSQNKRNKKNSSLKEYKYTNRLINESSPYLLEHAHNPVNWYPWGEEALEKAKKENKLVIVSIGYSSCHWCHVMEQDSFEDEKVAKFMNDHFVSIKVDREERPDIDQIYINAIELLTGSGGWPLNCIILPDGRPIYGGTFFSKKQWIEMISKIVDIAKKKPKKIQEQAMLVTQGVKNSEMIHLNTKEEMFIINYVNRIFLNWKNDIDYINGGEKRAPKFPLPIGYQFLLHYNYITKNKEALNAVTLTLDKMGNGGIYDQIGGGFSRYSTDSYWKVPHFEKMLYDNSQLVSLYSMAYQKTKNINYKNIVTETLHFIQRDLTAKQGGFYSSLDADSQGEEGKFYVWTKKEIKKILKDNANLIIDYYNITEKGNWKNGQNILFKSEDDKKITQKYKISQLELNKRIVKAKYALLKERLKRVKPKRDDKIITSWNALMIKAYVDAYRVFNKKKYLKIALKNAEFINTKIKSFNGKLYRKYKNGKASINAFLDDYSFTIQAFISLYQATFNEKWLLEARQLTNYVITHFYNTENGMFYYTSSIDSPLIDRKTEIIDNVIPSSNSQMAKNLFILGHYFYNDDYIKKSKKMLNNVKKNTLNGRAYYANWSILMMWFVDKPYEVAIMGNHFEDKRKEFETYYMPNVFLSGGKKEGVLALLKNKLVKEKTTIYVCQNKVCKSPVIKVKDALKEIDN